MMVGRWEHLTRLRRLLRRLGFDDAKLKTVIV